MKIKLTKLPWILACLLVFCAWVYGLFIDLTGDAGLYAVISQQMVESGDWLSLKLNGEPYDQKPHLLFWLAGIGIKLFGNTNFGFKLFIFLAGSAGIYFSYRLGRLLFSPIAGRMAALFVGTSQIYFLYFLDIHTDTVLQAAVILSLWQFAEYLKRHQPVNFLLAFAGIGLAMLTKGPVGAVLPFFFVLFSLLQLKDYKQLMHPKWLGGILIVVLIISPSLLHLWKNFGAEGLWFYFISNNIGRVSGEVAGSSTDPSFYVYNLLWAFLPWTIPVFAGLAAELKSWFRGSKMNLYSASMLGSVLVLFLVYSIARGKSPSYMMILIPPLAVVAVGHLQNIRNWPTKLKMHLLKIQTVVLIALILLLIMLLYIIQFNHITVLLILTGAGVFLMVMNFKSEPDRLKRIVFVSLVLTALLNLFLNISVLPTMFRYQGARQALHIFSENRSGNGILKNLQLEEYELFYWADLPVEPFTTWDEFYEFLAKDEPWVYTNESGLTVVKETAAEIDTVYKISQRGMNRISIQFLNPGSRAESLENNYLIKVK